MKDRDSVSKPTSAVKRKYNKSVYRRYEFSVNVDTKLNYLLEDYMGNPENNLSSLIKNLLCQHFDVDMDEIYMPYHLGLDKDGHWIEIPNRGL
jgi:hypothetical protein